MSEIDLSNLAILGARCGLHNASRDRRIAETVRDLAPGACDGSPPAQRPSTWWWRFRELPRCLTQGETRGRLCHRGAALQRQVLDG